MEPAVHNREICIAVLPLQNISDDPQIDIFCSGIVMDIITDLSRFRSFQIISYDVTSKLHPNERPGSALLDDLHLDYLVKGLVRFQHGKLLFNIQLVHVTQNRLVWAEKFSGSLEELFHIQEEVIEKIVVSLQHFVDYDLLSEIRKKPITTLNAYECWLRGFHELKKGTIEADEQARIYFKKALDIDPYYGRAYTGMSLTYFNEWSCQIWDRWEVSQKGAFEWAQKALEFDAQDHISTVILGKLYLYSGDYEKAEHFFRKALRLNANDADNIVHIAYGLVFLGYPEEARALYEKRKKLNPSGEAFDCGALIQLELGNIDEAIALAEKQPPGQSWVDFPALMAAAYYYKGDMDKMQASWQEYLRQFTQKINQGAPAGTQTALKWTMDVNPYKERTNLSTFWEYMGRGEPAPDNAGRTEAHPARQNRFAWEDGLWTFAFAGRQVRLPDLKGFHDIARLLSAPYKAMHCTELAGAGVLQKGEEVIDEKAKKTYRRRILALQEQIEEAEGMRHAEQAAALQQEYDQLLDHLSQSTGIGGRTRKVSGSIEKARTAVTWRIRSAIKRIAEVHPALGKHLHASIKTGILCEYAPEINPEWWL